MNRPTSHNEGFPSGQKVDENGARALEILTALHRDVIKRRITGAEYKRANRPISVQLAEAMEGGAQDEQEVA